MAELSFLSLEHVSYAFGKTPVVEDFSLEVEAGSFTTLLGPSGCGKTTLLRLISGFLTPQSGIIRINGINQAGIAPNLRKVGLVFQDYALFPHLTVHQNLLYGLKVKKEEPKEHWEGLVHQTARILGIAPLLERYPHELSGGQQQRVALGRALILKPSILLMDEPLSSLDARLRTQVREELRDIQQSLKITTVYVTHDQEEALSLSDTVAVMNHGHLLQKGSPRDVYFSPADRFVADFVGRANFITSQGKTLVVRPDWLELCPPVRHHGDTAPLQTFPEPQQPPSALHLGSTSLQHNGPTLHTSSVKDADLTGTLLSSQFLGQTVRLRVKLSDSSLCMVDVPSDTEDLPSPGENVFLKIKKAFPLA